MTPKILPTIPPEMHSRFPVIFFFQEFIQNASANASRISSVGSLMIPLEILWGLLQDFTECSLRNFSYRDAFENFSWNFPEIRSMKSSKDLSKNFSRDIFGDSSKTSLSMPPEKSSPDVISPVIFLRIPTTILSEIFAKTHPDIWIENLRESSFKNFSNNIPRAFQDSSKYHASYSS